VSQSFVHLHNHTDYSMLDGAARVKSLVGRAVDLKMPAIAISDHGFLFGAYDFWSQARKAGLSPIIGVEAYVTPRTHRSDQTRTFFASGGRDDVSASGSYTHMTMWAETTEGMHNLFRMGSLASLEGTLGKYPRVDRELLQTYSKGLIATTGCPSGEVQTFLHFGMYREAVEAAAEFRDILGEGNYFCEIMDHGIDIERRVRADLLRLAKDLNLPLVATNDLHYVDQADARAHEGLLCVQVGKTLTDPTHFKFDGDGYYLKTADAMRSLFRELPEACDNTLRIAERCHVEFLEGESRYMPRFPVPAGEDETSWFIKEVERGLREKCPGGIPQEYQDRKTFEQEVIIGKRYPGYYLVVADLVRFAKESGIRVGPGRGSGPGSICAWAMGITDLDPIRHKLLFERFLNPERDSPPDFDIDFDDRRRTEVVDYAVRRYGTENVAQVVTYGTIKAKQAVKDAARVMGYPFTVGERVGKALPPDIMGKSISLPDIFNPDAKRYDEASDLRDLIERDEEARGVVDFAMDLEGLKRQWGVHAAAVIMSSKPLMDVIPIMRRPSDGHLITQFDYPSCEHLGLLKMDFLGLRNLGIMDDAIANIRAAGKTPPEIVDYGLDDEATFALLQSGHTLGVFQLDGGPMRSLLRMIWPRVFEHISAVLALYRPGPMGVNAHIEYADRMNGRKPVVPIHPELAEPLADILDETYGLIVYQEQVQQIAQRVAGYSLGQADMLRRAMGKKKKEVLDAEYVPFEQGMRERGYSPEAIKTLWDTLVPFADYAFNRCGFGDTEVWLGASGSNSTGKVTLEELHRRLHENLLEPRGRWDAPAYEGPCLHCQREDRPAVWRGRCKACKSWWIKFRNSGLTALSLDTDGRIRPRRIKDVHYNGVREGFKITLVDGKSITATANHRHMTPSGWRQVSDLAVGDCLMVVSDDVQKSNLKYDYRVNPVGPRNSTVGKGHIGGAGPDSPGYIDGGWLALQDWTERTTKACAVPGCERSAAKGDRIERAHLDGDRTNNDPSNLRMLCASHHKAHDYEHNHRKRRWEVGKPVAPVEIVSIESMGWAPVYDLEMDAGPDDDGTSDGCERSWVGNGIVTHNSHTAAYGLISYWTAYLKANFPAEYMAALLDSVGDDKDKMALYLNECRRMGVKVLLPDVNQSQGAFTPVEEGVRFGLSAVRNVGQAVVSAIIATREEKGEFTSFEDFVRKNPANVCNKRTVEALIRAGAFDSLGHPRQGLIVIYEDVIDSRSYDRKAEGLGMESLFDEPLPEREVPDMEWDQGTRLEFERQMLGLYVSGHPLQGMEEVLDRYSDTSVFDLMQDDVTRPEGDVVTLTGLMNAVEIKRSKKGDYWASLVLEDLSGSVECLVFPKTYAKVHEMIAGNQIAWVSGKVSRREDTPKVFVDDVRLIDPETIS
jgi:DNA-directed DNA polymerase III PolC